MGIWALLADPRAGRDGERSFRQFGGKGGNEAPGILAGDTQGSKGMAGALGNAVAILEGVLRDAPAIGAKSVA